MTKRSKEDERDNMLPQMYFVFARLCQIKTEILPASQLFSSVDAGSLNKLEPQHNLPPNVVAEGPFSLCLIKNYHAHFYKAQKSMYFVADVH